LKTSPDDEHYVDGIFLPPKGADVILPPKGADICLEVGAHVDGLEVMCVLVLCVLVMACHPKKQTMASHPNLPTTTCRTNVPRMANRMNVPTTYCCLMVPMMPCYLMKPMMLLLSSWASRVNEPLKNLDAMGKEEASKNTSVMLGIFLRKFHSAVLLS
jgi:hypothetical protein